ncbi:MFS transporter [Insolitispirillum peregrinum]|uniref:MFS transporter n=1 Tax=Insolitispirillum peregrinum TaxID=80876 RepID=UPI0036164A75
MSQPAAPTLRKTTLFAMAAACGLAVANIYYNQPLLGLMEADFDHHPATAFIPTTTQLGYALGLLLLVPLGDIVERRRLIMLQFAALAVALAGAALAPSAVLLAVASLVVGANAAVAQQIVPFAATLSSPDKRGSAIGTVMAGLLSGILLSRTVSGFVGEHGGWRVMFALGIPLALLAAAMMRLTLPKHHPTSPLPYRRALWSLGHLWLQYPALRSATLAQAALFGAFSAFWSILALYLQGPEFALGADVAGLFGVIGAVGIFAAPLAGKIADRRGPHVVVWLGAAITLLSWGVFAIKGSLLALVAGVVLLDFGVQSAMVSHQHIIYALAPEARSRINTVFMTGMFLGGAAGSAAAALAWAAGQWSGVCLLGAACGALALLVKGLSRRPDAHG